ncbi:MAG: class I SAM-dependent methyltransferase [Actinomycetota bacterium]
MATRRRQLIPWKAAGTRTEMRMNADEVVRETGWVFNNQTGGSLTLQEFVETGDAEVSIYLDRLGWNDLPASASILEIGSGIGRMTAALTRRFDLITAADVDAAFLERCRETVARHGRAAALRTSHIVDGHSIDLPDSSVDAVFSYITLQHCRASDAVGLTRESFRTVRPGGRVALNYRTWVPADVALVPAGAVMRFLWNLPVVGARLSTWRWSTRLGWQANRLDPRRILAVLEAANIDVTEIAILHHPGRPLREAVFRDEVVPQRDLDVANQSHWWLLARCR